MQDSERKTHDSLQKLTECLCDVRNMPLLHDPPMGPHTFVEVDLCYKAIPHYKSLVTKRETEVNRRIKEGEEAARLEERAEKAEKDAKEKETK